MILRAQLARLRDWLCRGALVRRLDEEMQFHLEELTAEYQRRGLSPAAALQAARRDLGNTTRTRENLRAQAGWPALEEWVRDTTLAVRGLWRRPLFAGGVTLILTLGLGTTTALLVLFDAVFMQPLPVRAPEELYLVRDAQGAPGLFSGPTVRRLAAALPPGSGVAARATAGSGTVQIGAAPAERVEYQFVQGDFFAVLGLQPRAGRLLRPEDDRIGEPARVAVVTESWAQEHFGSAEAALGAELRINQHRVGVIGVLPPSFRGLELGSRTNLWLPAALQPLVGANGNARTFVGDDRPNDADWNREERVSWMNLVVRWPASLPAEAFWPWLQRALAPAVEDLSHALDDPQEREALRTRTWSLDSVQHGYTYRRSASAAAAQLRNGVVLGLLLLTAANVSNLLLIRTLGRHREVGVRLALGSGSWRVSRLVLVETLVLGVLGSAGGLVLAQWLAPASAALFGVTRELPLTVLEWRPLAALAGLTLLVSGLCAWAPTAWISRIDPLNALAGRMAALRTPQQLGRTLVALQLALAVIFVMVAVGLSRELQRALQADPGFAAEHVLVGRFDAGSAGYAGADAVALYQRVATSAQELPGVSAVGFARNGILAGSISRSTIYPRGTQATPPSRDYQSDEVSASYLQALRFTLLRGRFFTPADGVATSGRAAVVTATFAEELFPGIDPIGQRFGYSVTPAKEDFTIVGVVADARINAPLGPPPPVFFLPAAPTFDGFSVFALRTDGDPDEVAQRLRTKLAHADPGIVWPQWRTLGDRIRQGLHGQRVASHLVLVMAVVALSLAAVGVGVSLAHLVALRRREIAIRMALGANRQDVVRTILADAWRVAALGGVGGIGVVLMLHTVPALRPHLGNLWDGWAIATALAAAVLAALVGAWGPARRATRLRPQQLLSAD